MTQKRNWGGREENQPTPLWFFFPQSASYLTFDRKIKKNFSRSVGARCKDMNDVWLEACHAASSAFYTQHPLILKKGTTKFMKIKNHYK